jgi:hypothetical protein
VRRVSESNPTRLANEKSYPYPPTKDEMKETPMNHPGSRYLWIVLVAIALVPHLSFAQSAVGKLAGKVTDAESGEPLIGANVLVEEIQTGAATDINGEYAILNLPPGNYSVRISYIGYQPQVTVNVRVVAGVTKDLDVKLKATAVEVGEVVIVAERPLFEPKATNTVKVYDNKEIAQLPVRGVQRVVSLQAGVVSAEGSGGVGGNATLNIRGGRGGEVLYIVDGVPQNDVMTGTNYSQVSDRAVEQVAFQVGGYEAKYGQAQSGIVNVSTRTGGAKYSAYGEVVTSEFTDDFGYNLYTLNLSGPFVPGDAKHTFFGLAERGYFKDANPSAVGVKILSPAQPDFRGDVIRGGKPIDSKFLPENSADLWRLSMRTYHNLDFMTLRLGANGHLRNGRTYVHTYAKNNSHHNPRFEETNQSYTGRFSKEFAANTYLNVNLGMQRFDRTEGDGVFFDNLLAYGDTSLNRELRLQGIRYGVDSVGVFFQKGRQFNGFTKQTTEKWTFDADFFSQIDNHLLEVGTGVWTHRLRYLNIAPTSLAVGKDRPFLNRARALNPTAFGYWFDSNGNIKKTAKNQVDKDPATGNTNDVSPRYPLITYGYVQDRFELEDIVLNLGVRFDYLDTKAKVLRNEALPFAFGDTTRFDDADFVTASSEFYVSPRIGLGFPVTPTTVFHAQWGKFIQMPRLIDVYTSVFDLDALTTDENLGVNTGHVNSERTTQYEVGFRQILGQNQAALNVTAFYKNTEGLTNTTTRFFQRVRGGATGRYFGPSNYDFGTIKGLAFTVDVRKISYFWLSFNYTLSIAEGTGSTTNSSLVATFRNNNGEVPAVIAPLDFDQRHTGTLNAGFVTGPGELGAAENVSVSLLASFQSGRPYTPLVSQDILSSNTNYGDTKGYVNSAYGPGSLLLNLKVEKSFFVTTFQITPYVWVENLLDSRNPIQVYRSTGSAYTTGWLDSPQGVAASNSSQKGPGAFRSDYRSLEVDPANFGVPRQIRLGLRVGFDQK